MTKLPQAFADYTRQMMGDERFERYLKSFGQEPPVSIRLNPRKAEGLTAIDAEPVPWCRDGYYLKKRPNFTMDPLLHAGCYYVQEAASMFLDEVLRQAVQGTVPLCDLSHSWDSPRNALDLCAAPGGKSTLLRAALPDGCMLYSNEPIRNRFNILSENVQKWGYDNYIVTCQYARDFRKAKQKFDLILCDVPCSGEGMFRKDPATISEWSPQNVEKCWRLQRDIVADIWPCLNDGGILIYSTCTFNTKENEENVRWLLSEYDAEVLPVDIKSEWNITGSLLEGFTEPVYRFIPGISRSEGLFMCALRKGRLSPVPSLDREGRRLHHAQVTAPLSTQRGVGGESVDLTYQQAIAFLRGEALQLPEDTPRGEVEVCFEGHPLGLVKNIGTRANNLYPKAWRIKTTHIPPEYEPILEIK
jgi:16S rRNA C967 or C1407 C5-methylase (RsmB/RsmF family)